MEEEKNIDLEEEVDAPEITLDELLQDPKLQAQFDTKAEGMRKKWLKAWQEQAEAEKIEAEKLARMSEEEKHNLAISKEKERADKAIAELNAFKLKDEAYKIASEKGLDVSLLDVIDYGAETAETIKNKIDIIDSSVKKMVEKEKNDLFKQNPPKQVQTDISSREKAYLDEKYKNNPYYKG